VTLTRSDFDHTLIYPIVVPAGCFVFALFLMPEIRKISIWKPKSLEPHRDKVAHVRGRQPCTKGTTYSPGRRANSSPIASR
jgi:hypothetical protein